MNRPPAASLRHWIRLFAVYLSIPITLLLCAGDLGWWQAWIYALLLVGTGVGGRLLAEQRHPGLMAERQDRETLMGAKSWDRIMAPLMALSVSYPLMVVAGLDHRYGWSPEFPLWLVVPGLLLVLLGYGFGSWGLVENRFFSSVARIQKDRGHVVCDSGPYALVRHPGYAGSLLALPGIILGLASVWTILPALVALIIALIRTELEDRFLHEDLAGYPDYARRVRYRIVPFVY